MSDQSKNSVQNPDQIKSWQVVVVVLLFLAYGELRSRMTSDPVPVWFSVSARFQQVIPNAPADDPTQVLYFDRAVIVLPGSVPKMILNPGEELPLICRLPPSTKSQVALDGSGRYL